MKNEKNQKYEIVIYWDNDDKIFVAEAPELAGCSAHGKTQIDAVKNINEAVELWCETAQEFGDEIPEPRGRKLAA
ncbi:MAG TPA: type II toxin-antitoxin system HicB family antitoxin [Pyrinomonadaceae bacterium]|jgi:predicted RNase H-like HicB family nuclease|nr:type II toxin-antitoxin system HicB family antitoxin [Pyrinomonadaceae bacterium]